MTFLDQDITLDLGHIILIVALVVFVFFVAKRCSVSCSKPQPSEEGLEVAGRNGVGFDLPLPYKSPCACSSSPRQKCAQNALEKAKNGLLYGCNPLNPYVPYSKDECNYQLHKAILHGCQGG